MSTVAGCLPLLAYRYANDNANDIAIPRRTRGQSTTTRGKNKEATEQAERRWKMEDSDSQSD
jgi:hypothetical protein